MTLTYSVLSADCPTRLVLDHVADKWAALILKCLSDGPLRFNELRRRIHGLSQKVLSQALKRLERDGLVSRRAFATVPVTVEYAMTPLARTLCTHLFAIAAWAEANVDAVLAAQARYDSGAGADVARAA